MNKTDWTNLISRCEIMLQKEEDHWRDIAHTKLPHKDKNLFLSKSESFAAHLKERIQEYKEYSEKL